MYFTKNNYKKYLHVYVNNTVPFLPFKQLKLIYQNLINLVNQVNLINLVNQVNFKQVQIPMCLCYNLKILLYWMSDTGTPVSSTNKTDCQDITEILLKVELSTINQTKPNRIHMLVW
jgi:hypothetical protein